MIVVKVELHSAITGKVTQLGEAIICNDGTGTRSRGNYYMHLFGKNGTSMKERITLQQWPRQAKHVWALVARMLKGAYPE